MKAVAEGIFLQADLNCELDGNPFSIKATNNLIVVHVPDLRAGMRLIRTYPRTSRSFRAELHLLIDWLRALHSTLELRVGGICVATIGDYRTMSLASLLGFKGLLVRPIAIARIFFADVAS